MRYEKHISRIHQSVNTTSASSTEAAFILTRRLGSGRDPARRAPKGSQIDESLRPRKIDEVVLSMVLCKRQKRQFV